VNFNPRKIALENLATDFENDANEYPGGRESGGIRMQGFAGGRRPKPKVVVSTFDNGDEDVENVTSATESIDLEPPTIPAVKRLNRPQLGKKSSGSKLKLSFGAEEVCCSNTMALIS
jgi:hypothetical protein